MSSIGGNGIFKMVNIPCSGFPYRAVTRHHGDFSVMGTSSLPTFPEVLLAHASQMTGQLSQSMQIRRARDSINAMLATIISESFTSPWNSWWLQCVRSARDPLNRWISISIASPLPGPGSRRGGAGRVRLWTLRGPPGPRAPGPPRCGSRACSGSGSLPPACRWWAPPLRAAGECRLAVPSNPTVAAFAHLFPRGLFPPPFQYWGIRSFWPRGGRRGHVHLGLGEGRLGWIGARAARQLRAFRPPGGAHEGSVESCSGVGAHLESSGGACQE